MYICIGVASRCLSKSDGPYKIKCKVSKSKMRKKKQKRGRKGDPPEWSPAERRRDLPSFYLPSQIEGRSFPFLE